MADTFVLSGLIRKYREISGRAELCEKQARSLRVDLAHLEATIRLFSKDYETSKIPPKRLYRRNRLSGKLSRKAIDLIREAMEPLSSREIALELLRMQGVTDASHEAVKTFRNTLTVSLNRKEKAGVLVSVCEDGLKRWRVVG